jgi:hypothetical protein
MITRLITKFKHQTADLNNAERQTPNRFFLLITDPWLEKLKVFKNTNLKDIFRITNTIFYLLRIKKTNTRHIFIAPNAGHVTRSMWSRHVGNSINIL